MDAPSAGPAPAAPAATGTIAATLPATTMPDTDMDTDWELFVELSPVLPCEHPAHGDGPHHADGNEHYCHIITPCMHGPNGVFVVCAAWLEWTHSFKDSECRVCGWKRLIADTVLDLGLVADYHR